MEQLKVGYLPLVKGSWVNGKQEIRRAEVIGMFSKLDAEIVEEGRIIVTEEEANSSIAKFEQERVDAVIVHFLSFALGAVVPAAARRLGVPVIFWSEPEPPWDGGRIQKNSFCGTNCNAHALWKMRLPYTFVYGASSPRSRGCAICASVRSADGSPASTRATTMNFSCSTPSASPLRS